MDHTTVAQAEAFLFAELDERTQRHVAHMLETGSARWAHDPEVDGVFAVRATWPGQPVLVVVYTNRSVAWDFELSATLEDELDEL